MIFQSCTRRNKNKQEHITRSVQLPYNVCKTAFSQVGLFLDQLFPISSFYFLWILSPFQRREKNLQSVDSIERTRTLRNVSIERYAAASLAHVESANKTHGIVEGPV